MLAKRIPFVALVRVNLVYNGQVGTSDICPLCGKSVIYEIDPMVTIQA